MIDFFFVSPPPIPWFPAAKGGTAKWFNSKIDLGAITKKMLGEKYQKIKHFSVKKNLPISCF